MGSELLLFSTHMNNGKNSFKIIIPCSKSLIRVGILSIHNIPVTGIQRLYGLSLHDEVAGANIDLDHHVFEVVVF